MTAPALSVSALSVFFLSARPVQLRAGAAAGLRPLLAVVLLVLLGACAQPARVTQMTVPDNVLAPVVAANPELLNSVAVVAVSGGKETNPLWTSQVNDPEFREALERSLEFSGVLAPAPDKAAYAVSVQLMELKQPLMGFDLTVTSTVDYRVTERAGGGELLRESVMLPYTADFSSSLIAVERLRLANEGAIRENIRKFLARLGESWVAAGKKPPAAMPAAPAAPPAAAPAGKPVS